MVFILTVLLMVAALVLVGAVVLASRIAGAASHLRVLLALGLFGVVTVGVAVGVILFFGSKAQARLPEQPLAFPHTIHAGTLGLDCTFCHRTAQTDAVAGLPAVEQCMFCHKVAGRDKPGVQTLVQAWEAGEPLNWVRIHRVPDSVHFDHSAHLQAEVTCAVCHGPVETMTEVRPFRPLKMGDCRGCHGQRSAPTSCDTCHY